MPQKVFWLLLAIILGGVESSSAQSKPLHRIRTVSTQGLQDFFLSSALRLPILSAHRGGPAPGFPENAIETFEHTLQQTYAVIECDVRESSDGHLFLLHDSKLPRTTNGTGLAYQKPWANLRTLRLRDQQGKLTKYRIPGLTQTLKWAQGKTILFLDIKNRWWPASGAKAKAHEKHMITKVVRAVQKQKAHGYVVLITYNLRQARLVHQLDKKMMLSVGLRSLRQVEQTLRWIPARRILAFTGVIRRRLNSKLYDRLRKAGITTIAGTFSVESIVQNRLAVSSQTQRRVAVELYRDYIRSGVDVLATNRVDWVAAALRPLYRQASRKASPQHQWFKRFLQRE